MLKVKIIEGLNTTKENAIEDIEERVEWWIEDNKSELVKVENIDIKFMPYDYTCYANDYKVIAVIQYHVCGKIGDLK